MNNKKIELYNDGIGYVELVNHMGTELDIANYARQSFDKQDIEKDVLTEKDIKLISTLISKKHMTPFEHCKLTFHLTVPLFVRSQIQRYRAFVYMERSLRYCKDGLQFYIAPGIDKDIVTNLHLEYQKMLVNNVKPENARMILPLCTYTRFYMTCDLRNLLHFLDERLDEHAQLETRKVAKAISQFVKELYPNVHQNYYLSEALLEPKLSI